MVFYFGWDPVLLYEPAWVECPYCGQYDGSWCAKYYYVWSLVGLHSLLAYAPLPL